MASLLPAVAARLPASPGGPSAPADPVPGDTAFAQVMDEALPESEAAIEAAPTAPTAGLPAAPPLPLPAALGAAAPAAATAASAGSEATAAASGSTPLVSGAPAGLLPAAAAALGPAADLALAAGGGKVRDLAAAWPPPGLSALFPGAAAAATTAAAASIAAARAQAVPLLHGRIALPDQADAMAQALARTPALLTLPRADSGDERGLIGGPDALGNDAWAPVGSLLSPTASLPRLELPPNLAVPVPMHSPRFADETGARVQWLAAQGGGEATLRISPDGLGPVEIRLNLDGDRVDIALYASQADTRQALEQALPRLREMLAQQGLSLGHADVGQGRSQGSGDSDSRRSGSGRPGETSGEGRSDGVAMPASGSSRIVAAGRGLLDLYA